MRSSYTFKDFSNWSVIGGHTLRNINALYVNGKHCGNFGGGGVDSVDDIWDGDSPRTQVSLSLVM